MKKLISILCAIAIILPAGACGRKNDVEKKAEMSTQKEVPRIARYGSEMPKDYKWFDYKEVALQFDNLVFDIDSKGTYLPLIWKDKTHNSFGFPAYVGDGRMGKDGEQEGVATISAVLSATLMGIDKSNQNGENYVSQLHAYFSETEGIVLNNPGGKSEKISMWYMLYPAILFAEVSRHYPKEEQIRKDAMACVEKWYQAFKIMKESKTFAYTGFDFAKMKAWENGVWKEPDCVTGIAVLLKFALDVGDLSEGKKKDYRDAIDECIDYLISFEGSPLYEILLYFAPAIAAELNAKRGKNYDLDDILGDLLNGGSIPRGGWGQINGIWGEYSINGLYGSTTDGGGYAFSMNTFAGGYALAPLAKYDTRYAKAVAVWFLNASAAARYFFPGETKEENQSASDDVKAQEFLKVAGKAIPYEGIRKSHNSKTPWVGGDPTVYGWAKTDLSLYSGAHTGMFAKAFESTNVEQILKIDCNLDNVGVESYATYLLYNPYDKEEKVRYQLPEGNWDLFDSVEKKVILQSVNGQFELTMHPKQAMVLVEIPAGQVVEHTFKDGVGKYQVNDLWIASDTVTLILSGYKNNQEVKGKADLQVDVRCTHPEIKVKEIRVEIDGKKQSFPSGKMISLHTKDYSEGSKSIVVQAVMSEGGGDKTVIRLNFKH